MSRPCLHRRPRPRPHAGARVALWALALAAWLAPPAHADRHEASIAVRPGGQLARIADRGTGERAVVPGGGLAGGLSWGVRNWLDLGGELAVSSFGEATYELATLPVGANPRTGSLSRRTRTMQLRGLATLRLGVGWVPTIQLAAGAGARQRSAARLRTSASQMPLVLVPDGEDAALALDLIAALRIGLDRRLTRRWTIGASVGAAHCFGVGTPDMQVADATISISYNWYHLW
jgi:hypothetical protein